MNLLELNVDCLVQIFKFVGQMDLRNLCLANDYVASVIEQHFFYSQSLDLLMCGHRNQPAILARTKTPLTFLERITVSENWQSGSYRELEFFNHSQMFPTKLHVDRNYLYLSHTNYIRRYRRCRDEPMPRIDSEIGGKGFKSDIADFVKKGDTMFAGRACGSCFIYDCESRERTDQQLHSPKEYLYCVDFGGDIFVSSSNSRAKVWHRDEQFGQVHLDLVRELPNSYKSLKISSGADKIYGGLYTDQHYEALREINVETGDEMVLNSRTISIYDIKLKDDNVLFTAHFDASCRLFDRRTNRDEIIWEDPFNSSFYCLDYDGLHGVLAGTKYYGRANLYDIRVPKKHAQLYFPRGGRRICSPVYSVGCDSRFLFIATDHSVRVMDFKSSYAVKRDYRIIFGNNQ